MVRALLRPDSSQCGASIVRMSLVELSTHQHSTVHYRVFLTSVGTTLSSLLYVGRHVESGRLIWSEAFGWWLIDCHSSKDTVQGRRHRGGRAAMAAPLFGPFKKRKAISSSLDTYIPWTVVSSILVVSAVLALDVYVRVFQ